MQRFERYLEKYDRIAIEDHFIGEKEPVFIVAEAACNHMGNMDLAKKMVDLAAKAGVDAIKFQTYKAEKLVTSNATAFWGKDKISQLEYYKRLDRFGKKEYTELFKHARDRGVIPFSTPFDDESVDILAELNMSVFKIASCDIINIKHLQHIASLGKPIILSTGASTVQEVDSAIEAIFKEGNYQVVLLACTLSYPTEPPDANLLRIKTLKDRYPGIVVGISDHTSPDPHMMVPSMAVALGAKVIEKHYTLDRSMKDSGHFFAMEPDDLKKMVQNIRLAETILGDGLLGVLDSEKRAWANARRRIVAERLIRRGEVITEEMLIAKRSVDGLPCNVITEVIGKKAKLDIEADRSITMEMLE